VIAPNRTASLPMPINATSIMLAPMERLKVRLIFASQSCDLIPVISVTQKDYVAMGSCSTTTT
jgi:hypothetical protein